VGAFHAGDAFNVIAEEAQLCGTTRTFDQEVWQSFPERIERIAAGICTAMGAEYRLDYQPGHPVTVNDAGIAERARRWAAAALGEAAVVTPEATMTGEDFSYYLEKVPGCMLLLGTGRPDGAPLHSPRFDFSEEVLLTGVEIYCRAALDLLAADAESL
jgi:metal-dependent amidase/aminoacylase/carboxypeptidase family protein